MLSGPAHSWAAVTVREAGRIAGSVSRWIAFQLRPTGRPPRDPAAWHVLGGSVRPFEIRER